MSKPKAPPPDPYLEAQKKKAMEEEAAREAAELAYRQQEKFARRTGQRGAQSLLSGTFLGFPEGGTGKGKSQQAPAPKDPSELPNADLPMQDREKEDKKKRNFFSGYKLPTR